VSLKWIGITLVAALASAQSQTEEASRPKFDVTSVKPNKSPDLSKSLMQWQPGGRFVATNMPLIRVIAVAWGLSLQTQRLTLAPGVKMPEDIYDIEATAVRGTFPPRIGTEERMDKMRLMVQALLEDRFQLRVRREPREQPVYALVVGKGGLKIGKSKFQEERCGDTSSNWISNPACHWMDGGQNAGLHGASVTIASVVEYLNNFTDRPLLDKTGLTGFYDVQTEGWAPMKFSADGALESREDLERPTLFSVFEKLGLRMESQRAVIDMFVIDHVEKPHEN
jgi:uncharacterized protein (TIGR03435 family)